MSKCLHCYKEIPAGIDGEYHPKCIKAFYGATQVPVLPYHLSEIEQLAKEAVERSVTVPGVQPKLSLGWIKGEIGKGLHGRLTILDALNGEYILKPQNAMYRQMPENEHLSMKLAELFKIDVVPYSMIRMASGELCYITKRIDRKPDGTKTHMIDFMQILELEDKYKGTMETLGKTIGNLSANTLFDKLRFFEITLFCYLIGNNDMHLKNFSMLLGNIGWTLSPAYDMLNVKLILPKDKEDLALMLGGKKENFNKEYFNRFANHLNLNEKQVNSVYNRLNKWQVDADQIIDMSFLDIDLKKAYKVFISKRIKLFTA